MASGFSQKIPRAPNSIAASTGDGVQVVGRDDSDKVRPFPFEQRAVIVVDAEPLPAAAPLLDEAIPGLGNDVTARNDVDLRDRRHRRRVAERYGRAQHGI